MASSGATVKLFTDKSFKVDAEKNPASIPEIANQILAERGLTCWSTTDIVASLSGPGSVRTNLSRERLPNAKQFLLIELPDDGHVHKPDYKKHSEGEFFTCECGEMIRIRWEATSDKNA